MTAPPTGGLQRRLLGLLSWLGIVVLAVAVALLVLVSLLPRVSGWHFLLVAGGSMEPTIPLGSVAVMREVEDPTLLAVGTIIEYRSPETGAITTHRVVARGPGGTWFETRGDANRVADRHPVPAEEVIARYVFHVPGAGRLVAWLQSPRGFLVAVFVPGLMLIGLELRAIARVLRAA